MSIKEYICANLSYISHPFNINKSAGINLPDLKALCQLLDNFLGLPNHQQLGQQITAAVEHYQNLAFSDTTGRISALLSLVFTVEPFMKAVGCLRYADNPEQLKEVKRASLKDLLQKGQILANFKWEDRYSETKNYDKHCNNYWSEQECTIAIGYEFSRLRNKAAHKTINDHVEKISTFFNITLSLILLIINHDKNRSILELKTSPYYSYIESISNNFDPEYEKYVSLQVSLKWVPSSLDDQILFPMFSGMSSTNPPPDKADEISTLTKQVDKIILTGECGAGKTRTLRHTAVAIAKEILSLKSTLQQIPIYFPADILNPREPILTLFQRILPTIHLNEIQNDLELGRYWLFIDGLNEVAPQRHLETIQEIKVLFINYPKCRIIIATRQETYNNELLLPVYELQKLTPYGVKRILELNSKTEEQGCQLFKSLKKDKHLLAVFKTPLMSKLLCELPKSIYIPRNVGEMMDVIFTQIFEREERKGNKVTRSIKNKVLIELAKKIRNGSGTATSEESVLQAFRDITQNFSHETCPSELILKLIDRGVLERRNDGQIGFFHETALDYFSALGLKDEWDKNFSCNLCQEIIATNGTTTITMLAGLVTNIDQLTQYIAEQDLKLAAICYSAHSNRSNKAFKKLLEKTQDLLLDDSSLAVQSMAALDEVIATNAIFAALPKLSGEALKSASRALIEYAPSGVVEAVQNALASGEFTKKLVAIQFASAHQLIEVEQALIILADQHQANLAGDLAKALGHLETPKALAYLEGQLEVPADKRSVPLDVAILAGVSEASATLLKKALFDSEVNVRQAAINRIEAIDIADLDSEMTQLVKTDSDFLVRLIGAQIILRRASETQREDVIKSMFSSSLPEGNSFPSARILKVLSLLRANEIEEVILQALCQSNLALQSLIFNKLLSREPRLALTLFDLIDFQDPKVPSGVKAALVRAVIQTNDLTPEMLQKGISPLAPIGVRIAIAQTLIELPDASFETTLEMMFKDPSENVKAEICKTLCNSSKKINDSMIFPFLFDSSRFWQKWSWRLVNKRELFNDKILIDLTKRNYSNYIRVRAIQELCDRRFYWSLNQVCTFVRDSEYGIRRQGQNILLAILSDSAEYPGKVMNYKVQSNQGFLIRLDTREKLFFRLTTVHDKRYILHPGDIVALKIDKDNVENVRFLG